MNLSASLYNVLRVSITKQIYKNKSCMKFLFLQLLSFICLSNAVHAK